MLATRSNHPFALVRSPYDIVHDMAYWTFTVRNSARRTDIEVLANFDKVTELTNGETMLSGTAMDEYGWWHGRVTISLSKVDNLQKFMGQRRQPEPAPFRVGITFEYRRNLVRLTVPDEVAIRLKTWCDAHWHEVAGMNTGWTSCPTRGTWEHKALAYLHSVQSHLTDDMPFIEGESFDSLPHGEAMKTLFVSTSGVRAGITPITGFHFAG